MGIVINDGLIGEVGDLKKFRNIYEIKKMVGIDLFEIRYGKHKEKRRIYKRGRNLMRKMMFFVDLNMVRENGKMQETYVRRMKGGMKKMKAMIAIDRKVMRVIFELDRDKRL